MARLVLLLCIAWLLCGNAFGAYAGKKERAAKQDIARSEATANVFGTGVKLYGQKKYQEALDQFAKVTRADPRNSSAYLYQANCRYLLGDTAGATTIYQYIVSCFPKSPAGQRAAQFFANSQRAANAAPQNGDGSRSSVQNSHSDEDDQDRNKEAPLSIASLVTVIRPRADRPAVSTSVINTIRTAVDRLPKSVKHLLWVNGIKVFVTPTVEDYQPGVKYQEARGYEGGTYKSCPAFYSSGKIVLAEHTLDESDETVNAAFSPQEMLNSLYHETGHALDDCLDSLSIAEDFKHSYRLDSARIEPATAYRLRYYLQQSTIGQGECLAELVGSLLGLKESHTNDMLVSFPLTLKFLRAKLQI